MDREIEDLTARKLRSTRNYVRQNVTVSLDTQTVRKVKILAARRGTSISALLGGAIEALVTTDDAYERAKTEAMSFLEKGLHLGGVRDVSRAELHER